MAERVRQHGGIRSVFRALKILPALPVRLFHTPDALVAPHCALFRTSPCWGSHSVQLLRLASVTWSRALKVPPWPDSSLLFGAE